MNSLVQAVANVVNLLVPNVPGFRYFSYTEDFATLWELARGLVIDPSPVGPRSTFLIVWDGMPPEPAGRAVRINKYLTPFDWAIAVSLGMADHEKHRPRQPQAAAQVHREPAPDFRIVIVDFASPSMTAADGVWFFSQLPQGVVPGLPWVHIFRPDAPQDQAAGISSAEFGGLLLSLLGDNAIQSNANILNDGFAEEVAGLPAEQQVGHVLAKLKELNPGFDPVAAEEKHWIENGTVTELHFKMDGMADISPVRALTGLRCLNPRLKFFGECDANARDLDLERIRRIWGSHLARPAAPDEHHAVANLVGPLLLMESETRDPHVIALQTLLERLLLVSIGDEKQPTLSTTNPSWINWADERWQSAIEHALRWGSRSRTSRDADRREEGGDELQEKRRPLSIVLVDDNVFRYGWGQLLCMAMGVPFTPRRVGGLELLGERDEPSSPIRVYGVSSGEQWLRLTGLTTGADPKADGDEPAITLAPGPASETPETELDLLFLDLRLHQGRGLAEEAEFFQQLLTLATQYCDAPSTGSSSNLIPGRGFTRDELNKVREWVAAVRQGRATSDQRRSTEYHIALTLFPRLLALMDHSLPIVLFSSTGQRSIVEILRPYGNIITAFDKPRLAGSLDPLLVANTAAKFQTAVELALKLVAGRRLCAELSNLGDTPNPKRTYRLRVGPWQEQACTIRDTPRSEATAHSAGIQNQPCLRVEAYFDETDDDSLRVGGLVIVYPNERVADAFAAVMRSKDIVWGWHREDPWEHKPPKSLKKSSDESENRIDTTLRELQEAAASEGIAVAVFSLGSADSGSQLPWGGEQDQLFRVLVRDSIELLLFEWIPRQLGAKTAEVGLYVATKVLVQEKGMTLLSLSRNFGFGLREQTWRPNTREAKVLEGEERIRTFLSGHPNEDVAYQKGKDLLRLFLSTKGMRYADKSALGSQGFQDVKPLQAFSFGFDDTHPIVAEVLDERATQRGRPRIAAAMGVQLAYYKRTHPLTPHQLPRQIHYASDWVIANKNLVPPEWHERGFWEDRDEDFRHLLQACRQSVRPSGAVDAVIEWSRASHNWERPIVQWASKRVADCIRRLTGEEFLRMCSQLHLERRMCRPHPTGSVSGSAVAPAPTLPSTAKNLSDNEQPRRPIIYVGNLGENNTKEEILEWFRDYSPVHVSDLKVDRSGRRWYAFVRFQGVAEAANVLKLAKARKRRGWPKWIWISAPK